MIKKSGGMLKDERIQLLSHEILQPLGYLSSPRSPTKPTNTKPHSILPLDQNFNLRQRVLIQINKLKTTPNLLENVSNSDS